MEVDPALRPYGLDGGRLKRRVEAGLADDERLRGLDELSELLPVGRVDRRLGTTLERDPLRRLTRDLPVDRTGRRQHLHHLTDVDLREVERRRVELAQEYHRRRGTGGSSEASPGCRRRRRAPRVEDCPPHGQCMDVPAIAVTGASGLVGQRLLPLLVEHPDVTRVVALDVREPGWRSRNLEFHRVDIAGTDLKPLFEGIDTVVHLAGVVDPIADEALMARVNVEGTRRVLAAAAAVSATRIVRISSAAVYGAWPSNPVPLTEDSAPAPEPALLACGPGRRSGAPDRGLA